MTAILTGKFHAAALCPPATLQAKKAKLKELLDMSKLDAEYHINGVVTTRRYLKTNEDTVRRFMKGYAAAIHHFVTKRDDSLAILKKYFPGNQSVTVDAMYESFAAQLRPLPELTVEAIQALVDVGAVADQRTKTLKPADIIEPRFLEELKGSKFLKDLYTEKVSL